MPKFTLEIDSDDAAMTDDLRGELYRMLTNVASKVLVGCDDGSISDSNGNKVGKFELSSLSDDDEEASNE